MQITISHNFPEVQRALDRLPEQVATPALASAMNKAVAQGQTQMVRAITSEFNLTASKVREKLIIRRASFKGGRFALEAQLLSRDPSGRRRAINVINFGARQVKGGVSIKVKRTGSRKVVRSAFIGNKGRTVFAREGRARLPIKPVQTIDVPQMFNTRRINAKVVQHIVAKFPALFEHEVKFRLQRWGTR